MTPKRVVCWFLAPLLLTGTVLAEDLSNPKRDPREPLVLKFLGVDSNLNPKTWAGAPPFRVDTRRLEPRVSLELESLSAYPALPSRTICKTTCSSNS